MTSGNVVARAMKFHEHGMKVVGRVLENRLHRIVIANEMQLSAMPKAGTIDATFILRKLQEKHQDRRTKLRTCLV